MTRPLHPETKPQRATRKSAQPKTRRGQGYEERDAPPVKLALGVAAFYSIMLLGLAAAAIAVTFIAPRMGLVEHAVAEPRFPDASQPPLLVDQVAHRHKIEAEARSHLDPQRLRQAAAEVEAREQEGAQ